MEEAHHSLVIRKVSISHNFTFSKKRCVQAFGVLEKILESPLDCKEIKPVHPKENQL